MKTNKTPKRKSSTNETSQRSSKREIKRSSCTYKVRHAKSGKHIVRKGRGHLGGAGEKKE